MATIRVGPLGEVPGASKLVRVRFVEPAAHDHIAVLPLRWEATGPAGRLFPVLDADITLMPAATRTRLVLAGSYRPPLDGIGATLDKIALHHVATATISSLLRKIAHALTHHHSPPFAPCGPLNRHSRSPKAEGSQALSALRRGLTPGTANRQEPNRASKPAMRPNNLFGMTSTAIPTAKDWRHIGYSRG